MATVLPDAGYSGRPLVAKLGLGPDVTAWVSHAPADYERLLGELPRGAVIQRADAPPGSPHLDTQLEQRRGPDVQRPGRDLAFVHLFVHWRAELEARLPDWAARLAPAGMLWVSWPKRSSGVPTDLSENVAREVALANGLVDVKVCAVDGTWSALKLVFRLRDRAGLS